MYYNARFYDPSIGRFLTADTIVPDVTNAQAFNRYAYVLNNPIKYTDPTGHNPEGDGHEGGYEGGLSDSEKEIRDRRERDDKNILNPYQAAKFALSLPLKSPTRIEIEANGKIYDVTITNLGENKFKTTTNKDILNNKGEVEYKKGNTETFDISKSEDGSIKIDHYLADVDIKPSSDPRAGKTVFDGKGGFDTYHLGEVIVDPFGPNRWKTKTWSFYY